MAVRSRMALRLFARIFGATAATNVVVDDDRGDDTSGQGRNGEVAGDETWAHQCGQHAVHLCDADRDAHVRHRQPARRHFGDDTDINPTGAKAVTVGATAAATVVVVNATRFHGGRASTDLGDDDRAAVVTILRHQADRGDSGTISFCMCAWHSSGGTITPSCVPIATSPINLPDLRL
jgi:hypothetical protein